VTDRDPSSLYEFDPNWDRAALQKLSRPVLVVALEGWVDAGMGASAAIDTLLTSSPTAVVASFDTETLIDQRARRPIARLEDGVTTELTWPAIRVVASKDRVGADILFLTGPEPDFRWPTFIDAVVGLAQGLDVRTVVGLGAFPAPTPHTRPVRLASTVPPQSVELAGRVGTVHGTLEVPAGVQAALEVALGEAGIPVIGLWARVPHYVSAMPYPEASAALIEGLCAVTGAVLDSSTLRDAAAASRRQVDELIGANPDHLEMVRRLEAALDSEEVPPVVLDVDVPTGDEIAAELEQFLRGEGH
jgi:predicted ATP-grasp superfamily ATP-dependent carboligase